MDNWYRDRKTNLESETLRIVLDAADIIKEDIQKVACDRSLYPDVTDITAGWEKLIPGTQIVKKKKNVVESEKVNRKCVAVNQVIISSVRSRSFLSQLQIGLALTLRRLYGSKHLIDLSSSMGVCAL